MTEKTKIIIQLICGIVFTYILFQSYHYDNIFQIFLYVIFGGTIIYLFFNGIFDNKENYKKTKELKSYSLTITGIIVIIINLGIFSYYEIKLNSQTLLKAENHGVHADFKKNGDYVIKSGSWASKKHFYGNYTLKDNIIIVDRNYFDDVLVTNKFAIRKIKNAFRQDDKGKIKNYLLELDKNGKQINNNYLFEIVEDNRE